MLYFNSSLFNGLSSVFGMTQEAFSMKVFRSPQKYKQRIYYSDRLLVVDLIQICNTLHMSISHFFLTSPTNVFVQDASHYEIDVTQFKVVSLLNANIKKVYGKNGIANQRLSQLEFAEAMGVSQVTLHTWESNPAQFRVSQLLRMCNDYNVPITLLLDDSNANMDELEPPTESWKDEKLISELRKIQEITSSSQREIRALKRELKEYKKGPVDADVARIGEQQSLTLEEAQDIIRKLRKENEQLRNEIFSLRQTLEEWRSGGNPR